MSIHCITLPAKTLDQKAIEAWLDDNVLGWVMGSKGIWSDATQSTIGHGCGIWNYHGGKPAPGSKHHGRPWEADQLHDNSFGRWDFEKRNEARAFQKQFGG